MVADSGFYDPFVGNTKASKTILSQDVAGRELQTHCSDSLQKYKEVQTHLLNKSRSTEKYMPITW